MKEYIEKDLVMDALLHERYGYCCEDAINKIPAADVVEVWHGEWVLSVYTVDIPDIHRWHEWHCSNCGYVRKAGWEHTEDGRKPDAQYCENCMAKMDGGVNDGKAD